MNYGLEMKHMPQPKQLKYQDSNNDNDDSFHHQYILH